MRPIIGRAHEFNADEAKKIKKTFEQIGYPFPAGPLIPRPDASWAPLWPSLLKEGLDRLQSAEDILLKTYTEGSCWTTKKTPMTPVLNLAWRNWLKRSDPQNSDNTYSAPLQVLQAWLDTRNRDRIGAENGRAEDFADLADVKLRGGIQDLYGKNRIKKSPEPLLFCPPYYSFVNGANLQAVKGPLWESQEQSIHVHVSNLLKEDAGEWNILTLLFLKLLHCHLAWILPANSVTEPRKNLYYRAVLRHLRLCTIRGDTGQSYPLASTAAGLLQTLTKVSLLISGDGYPSHGQSALDPRHPRLPDSLHIDSFISASACIEEVKQIFKWMDGQNSGDGWNNMLSWVDDVAMLAWDVASARTDPFALGALGLTAKARQYTKKEGEMHAADQTSKVEPIEKFKLVIERLQGGWDENNKACELILNLLFGKVSEDSVTEYQQQGIDQIPLVSSGIDVINQMPHIIDLGRQLRSAYGCLTTALKDDGLSEFQNSTSS